MYLGKFFFNVNIISYATKGERGLCFHPCLYLSLSVCLWAARCDFTGDGGVSLALFFYPWHWMVCIYKARLYHRMSDTSRCASCLKWMLSWVSLLPALDGAWLMLQIPSWPSSRADELSPAPEQIPNPYLHCRYQMIWFRWRFLCLLYLSVVVVWTPASAP